MKHDVILSIDQGTTSTKALLVDRGGYVVASGACPVAIGSPQPGWVEQDPVELWDSACAAIRTALAGSPNADIAGVAISNQRETVVAWDRSGRAVGAAIGWQDQRGSQWCDSLRSPEHVGLVKRLSGLEIDAMFSASKLAWCVARYDSPTLRLGTVDSWLLHQLTGGALYATEAGNASRTLLFDIDAQSWSPALGQVFGFEVGRLAQVRPSTGPWGTTRDVPGVRDGIPILAVLGDSHAALYGHWALDPQHRRLGKATYGTGSSVMMPVEAGRRIAGISTTLAWQTPSPQWALEGNILYSGAGMDWLARTLDVAPGEDFSRLAAEADGTRAVFVPALNGLGAPWWESGAVGTITGLDAATTRAEVARAGIESVAHQICDVVDAMDPVGAQPALHAGGGATASALLMQTQADLLGRPLLVSRIPDISALGAAALGFRAAGLEFVPGEDLAPNEIQPSASFTPGRRDSKRAAWRSALRSAGVPVPATSLTSDNENN